MEMPGTPLQTTKVAAEVARRTSHLGVSAPSRLCVEPHAGKSVQNPYKSDHFHECDVFTPMPPTTYNFDPLKCTDSPAADPTFGIRNSSFFRISSLVIRHWHFGAWNFVLGFLPPLSILLCAPSRLCYPDFLICNPRPAGGASVKMRIPLEGADTYGKRRR
jgi:hypothetical protein